MTSHYTAVLLESASFCGMLTTPKATLTNKILLSRSFICHKTDDEKTPQFSLAL